MTSEQQRFLDLRAQGKTYDQIAADLGVSRRTLFNWNRELQEEIAFEETAQLESLHQELLGTREARARRIAKRLVAVEDELDKRSLADLSTARLFSLADSLRRQLIKETTPSQSGRANVPMSPNQIPSAPIQESSTPPIQSSAQCNDSAIAVQPEPGRGKLLVSPDQVPALPAPTIQESSQLSIQPETVQPSSDDDWKSELSTTFDSALQTSSNPEALPPSPQCKGSATAVQSVDTPPLPREYKNPSSQRPRCQPISPERLVGTNINFREALRAAKAAQLS